MRAVLDLAMVEDVEPVQVSDIAQRTNIPASFLVQILLALKVAGIVSSKRGAGGGYTLARSPKNITVGDVLRVIDGTLDSDCCEHGAEKNSPNENQCSIRQVLADARDAMARVVDETSFADLAQRTKELNHAANGRYIYYI
jgi:Rrf2 family protein